MEPGPSGAEAALERLLDVQDADTTVDQLRHRVATAPERAALATTEERLRELEGRRRSLQARRDELGAAQAELERQIEAGRTRRQQIDQRMRSGQVTAARDLTAMDEEVRHLGTHVTVLEDREIEIMEELEPLDADLAALATEDGELRADAERHRQAVGALEQTVTAEIAEAQARRDRSAADVPAALLAQYERIRARAGGVGAARLVGGACTGCHLELPSMEVDRIRKAPPGTVATCEQCGRILVR